MIVCIAEKPSVARDIADVLGAKNRKEGYIEGNGYQVTWTFGHLCTLKEPHIDFHQSFYQSVYRRTHGAGHHFFCTRRTLANPGEQDWTAIIIILTMVIASSILRFWQEWKANASSEALLKMVTNTL